MRGIVFWTALALILFAGVLSTKTFENEFFFFAGYAILQAMIMAVAWNILGGFTGYVNFGSAGFFAIGAYTSIALSKALDPPMIMPLVVAALIGGLVGFGTGYLTLRLRGVYFAIATLAMAIVFETFVNNWEYVGAATGAYILTPEAVFFFDNYIEFLFALVL
ncbi:MAG TPA: branched-chain amino acid ABC transporter permease, partial [Geminicoccaceae bacterium]